MKHQKRAKASDPDVRIDQMNLRNELLIRAAQLYRDAAKALGQEHPAVNMIGHATISIRDSWPVPDLKLVGGEQS